MRFFFLLPLFLFADPLSLDKTRYQETLYPEWGQTFQISNLLYQHKSPSWEIVIFENPLYGKVLAIDGTVQLTEKDEPIYHEMLAHVPLTSHKEPKSVLILGGGDGGLLREVLRHESVQEVFLVEIDRAIIDLSQTYFPALSQGAFQNPKVQIVIQDAAQYVETTSKRFDIILSDSTDPIGPAKALFTKRHLQHCKRCLKEKGILVTQNGVPYLQKQEWKEGFFFRKGLFKHTQTYLATIPTYVGGPMAFLFSSDTRYSPSLKHLKKQVHPFQKKLSYYSPKIHKAAFTLPYSLYK